MRYFVPKAPTDLTAILRDHFSKSEAEAKELLWLGALYLNGKRLEKTVVVRPEDRLGVFPHPHRFPAGEVDWLSRVVSETKDYLIIDKPSGVPTHATTDNARENALQAMRDSKKEELFVTHRLDTPVSGILLFAKHQAFQKKFNQWLQEKKLKKFYEATTATAVPLGRHRHDIDGQEGVLTVEKCEAVESGFCSLIRLETGRTHQIRLQLSKLGAPILGDRKYGGQRSKGLGRGIALRAVCMETPAPTMGAGAVLRFTVASQYFPIGK